MGDFEGSRLGGDCFHLWVSKQIGSGYFREEEEYFIRLVVRGDFR